MHFSDKFLLIKIPNKIDDTKKSYMINDYLANGFNPIHNQYMYE